MSVNSQQEVREIFLNATEDNKIFATWSKPVVSDLVLVEPAVAKRLDLLQKKMISLDLQDMK